MGCVRETILYCLQACRVLVSRIPSVTETAGRNVHHWGYLGVMEKWREQNAAELQLHDSNWEKVGEGKKRSEKKLREKNNAKDLSLF